MWLQTTASGCTDGWILSGNTQTPQGEELYLHDNKILSKPGFVVMPTSACIFTCSAHSFWSFFLFRKVWFLLNQCNIFSYWFFHIAGWLSSPLRQDDTLDKQQSTALPWWFLRNWHHITKLAQITPLNEIFIRRRSYKHDLLEKIKHS